uniref:Uncharacterized protein n=1 Tax=Hyaloperonospora arabidopsidis (strain Emoy2) TaxID=559515 RepID=M4B602_HYAAE
MQPQLLYARLLTGQLYVESRSFGNTSGSSRTGRSHAYEFCRHWQWCLWKNGSMVLEIFHFIVSAKRLLAFLRRRVTEKPRTRNGWLCASSA